MFYSANIHYDLLRTGSVELTTNKILERGFLDAVRVPFSLLMVFTPPPPATRVLFHTLSPPSYLRTVCQRAYNGACRRPSRNASSPQGHAYIPLQSRVPPTFCR
jgi:hypothetical protein